MKLLLDTHILLWALAKTSALPSGAVQMIDNLENSIYYSLISLWEIEIKHLKSPDKMPVGAAYINELCKQAGYTYAPIQLPHILMLLSLQRGENEKEHKDPFDRLLLCQAKSSNIMLLTHDELLSGYNETCVYYV